MKHLFFLALLLTTTSLFTGCVTNVTDEVAEKVSVQDAKNFSSLAVLDQGSNKLIINGWNSDTINAVARISVWAKNSESAQKIAQELNFGWNTNTSEASLSVQNNNSDQELGRLEQLSISAPSRLGLKLETSSGDINVSNMTSDLNVTTSSGVQTLETKGHVVLESSSGNIDAKTAVGGSIKATSATVTLDVTSKDFDGVSVTTSSGDISVYIADGAKISFNLKSSSGSIKLRYGGTSTTSNTGELQININGGGKIVNLTSSSGSIDVETYH